MSIENKIEQLTESGFKVSDLVKKVLELEEAKNNTLYCLQHVDGLADMHGLEYWASVVERLRKELKSLL